MGVQSVIRLVCLCVHSSDHHSLFQVEWHAADALRPDTYAHLLSGVTGVVHTLGVLLENTEYKQHLRDGNVPALLKTFFGGGSNPLKQPSGTGAYDTINRDSGTLSLSTYQCGQTLKHVA